jgi:arsenite methyltransferase
VDRLAFDETMGRQLEALYETRDARRRRDLVRDALRTAAGQRILDVGCGPGFYCRELLAEVGPEGSIVGIDGSAQMLALAQSRCAGHDNVEFRQAEATALGVEDDSFDRALCVQVLEYVPDVPAALAELHRALRPGGRVVLWDSDWATLSLHSQDRARMSRVLDAWDEHVAHPSLPRTLAAAMRAAGFAEVEMQAHAFATDALDGGTFGASLIEMIAGFVAGRNRVSGEEAAAWAAEQRGLGKRGEFFFTSTQFAFTATRSR